MDFQKVYDRVEAALRRHLERRGTLLVRINRLDLARVSGFAVRTQPSQPRKLIRQVFLWCRNWMK